MGNSSSAAAASAEPEPVDLPVMTVADVAKHNTKQDCWSVCLGVRNTQLTRFSQDNIEQQARANMLAWH